ncbi:hypothetical protein Poly51_57120 [Rubripirellula tenax]|uniref:DUF58 domain-containing protein n=1 Tax=Rubripirellula tenax TaxID=2528015 RepID=A0A5C6EFE8_9BACT|nr:DUF58 domain-containing protein [Rubripirellula tenax]TWU46316.1 hypothetical protein Poly51_57120 [Rubripirellula tenax]
MKTHRSIEPRRKHRLTRLGFHFLFVGSFAMLGGALRGFNLLLVLAGLLVGTLIMQWRWSKRSVEAVSVTRRSPEEAFVGKPFRVRYMLRNHSRLMPVWMMRVEDRVESVDHSSVAVAICAAPVISAKQTVGPHCDLLISRRGRYRVGPITLMTTFPFSLFCSQQIVDDREEFHVFPEILTLRTDWRRLLISKSGGMSTTGRRSGPSEGDFFGLREWQTGDSPKWIHWRTTARMNEPAVRQFEQQRRFDTCIMLDAFRSSTDERLPLASPDSETDAFEFAISFAATLMIHLVGTPSNRVVLAIASKTSEAIIGAGSVVGKRKMLELLADVQATRQPDLREAANRALRIAGAAQDLVVISSRSLADARIADPLLNETIAPWTRRNAFRWINTRDREIQRWAIRKESSSVDANHPADQAAVEANQVRETATLEMEASS